MYQNKYKHILEDHYTSYDEDARLSTKASNIEFVTTMQYILKYAKPNSKILEIGAATGKYSIELARLGYNVTSVELVQKNVDILKEKSKGIKNIQIFQGDALNLSMFDNNTFDIVLNFGPMYHLYSKKDEKRAISETLRVCKQKGVCMFAYIGNSAVIFAYGVKKQHMDELKAASDMNWKLKNTPQEIFAMHYPEDFAKLFADTDTKHLRTIATDGICTLLKEYVNTLDDTQYKLLIDWHLATCERTDQLGYSSHLLYICKKI